MKTDSIRMSTVIPADPGAVYRAWMSSKGHAAMTGSGARVSAKVGGRFTAWDGYNSGATLEMEPGARIVQAWRTTEFAKGDPDSRLEVLLEKAAGGTRITLVHTDIPPGQGASYRKGWLDFYFTPMKAYFGSLQGKA